MIKHEDINPLMNKGLFYLISLDWSISSRKGVWLILLLPCLMDSPVFVFNANSVDTDRSPHSAASDLGLHSLPISLFGDSRHRWVVSFDEDCVLSLLFDKDNTLSWCSDQHKSHCSYTWGKAHNQSSCFIWAATSGNVSSDMGAQRIFAGRIFG